MAVPVCALRWPAYRCMLAPLYLCSCTCKRKAKNCVCLHRDSNYQMHPVELCFAHPPDPKEHRLWLDVTHEKTSAAWLCIGIHVNLGFRGGCMFVSLAGTMVMAICCYRWVSGYADIQVLAANFGSTRRIRGSSHDVLTPSPGTRNTTYSSSRLCSEKPRHIARSSGHRVRPLSLKSGWLRLSQHLGTPGVGFKI